MDLKEKIIEILKCYGFDHGKRYEKHFYNFRNGNGRIYIHFEKSKEPYWRPQNLQKSELEEYYHLTVFLDEGDENQTLLHYLEAEHLTLNSVCGILSNLF